DARISAGEGRPELADDAGAEPGGRIIADLAKIGRQEPARHAPLEPERQPLQYRRRGVERAIDVELLESVRSIAVIAFYHPDRDLLDGAHDGAAERAPAGRVEGDRGAGLFDRVGELRGEAVGPAVEDMRRAERSQYFGLLLRAHDVHQRNAV